ncbi:MAG: carboxypeptidase-like regulatory domain-containing protein, partial [Pyrinomonadaceae bacterium]
ITSAAAPVTFTVTYTDDFSLNVGSIDSNDVRVTGPGGYNAAATLMGVNNNTNGTPRTATYSIVPPGGSWDMADNGSPYTVVMQPNQVVDVPGSQPVAAGSIGTFTVNIPPAVLGGNIQQFNAPLANTPLAGVLVTLTGTGVSAGTTRTTGADGNFSFSGLSSGGNYTVTPTIAGKILDPLS